MNSRIGISIGCRNSCGIRKGLDSSSWKVFVMGQNIHLVNGIVVMEDAVEVSIFYTISEIKKK